MLDHSECLSWYNYETDEYELSGTPTTDEQAKSYLPQLDAAQGLYDVQRLIGNSILEAMIYVLNVCVGEPNEAKES